MQKQEKIVDMFDKIAPTYDKLNRILSFGIDISWRKNACKLALNQYKNKTINIVDIACGTGDMMDIWSQSAKKLGICIKNIIGIDPSNGMLEIAKMKFPDFHFIKAFADNTTLNSEFADVISISYGIRNVVDRKRALAEFYRVLKPGAKVVILEFTKRDKNTVMSKFRDFYLSKILPKIGGLISKNKQAYEYLPNSIENFLNTKDFCNELEETGFKIEVCKSYSMDISTLFIAVKK